MAASPLYVSTTGSYGGDGSASNPFSNLQQAVSAASASGSNTIYLKGGTYYLNSPIELTSANSGLTIESAPGSRAVLDGQGWLNSLVRLDGASGVTLQGLTFQYTDPYSRAAVVLNGASNNSIIADHFANNGEGLSLQNGSSYNTVSGNEIDNSSTSAVEVQDGSNNNLFDSNLINGTGAIGTSGGGIDLHGANYNTISHNLVENTAGMGIGVENWDSTTVNVGNVISDNTLQSTNTSAQSNDSGAIYELGRSNVDTQSVITGNYISGPDGGSGHVVGIYLDDNTSGVQVTNNIVANTIDNSVEIHGGNNVTVQNNVFDLGANGGSAVLFQDRWADNGGPTLTNDVVSQNIISSTQAFPTAFDNYSNATPTIDSNFYSDPFSNYFQMSGLPQNNAQYGNANFANEGGGNYALSSNSGATSIGFTSIDQSVIGLHPSTAHFYT